MICSATTRLATNSAKAFPSLRRVVLKSTEADANIPSLIASLEYYKYSGSADLPRQFMEAELDYFAFHMYDVKTEELRNLVTGKHDFEWRLAGGIFEDPKQKP